MIHVCMVKYGTEHKGFDIDKLTKDLIKPINNLNVKFHILTDRPIIYPQAYPEPVFADVRNYPLSNNNIIRHEHWMKTQFFDPKFIGATKDDETVVVDIDIFWLKDPKPVIEFPVEHGQFVSVPRWWSQNFFDECPISGKFYKFKSHDFKHVHREYIKNWRHYRNHYWNKGVVEFPNKGEQNFVYDMVKDSEIVLQPGEWCMKEHKAEPHRYAKAFQDYTGKNYYDSYGEAVWTHYRL